MEREAVCVITNQETANVFADPSVHVGDIADVPPGAFLVLRRNGAMPPDANEKYAKLWCDGLKKIGRPDIVVCVSDLDDIQFLSEADMNKLGWFRVAP